MTFPPYLRCDVCHTVFRDHAQRESKIAPQHRHSFTPPRRPKTPAPTPPDPLPLGATDAQDGPADLSPPPTTGWQTQPKDSQ